ncbi:hypothetical protein HanRHA438_Chr10g0431261 [Helianthus annuus]|nr:hypothetical protein HanRHA438_Chr10g0431261 [Helianthus annuus]
MMRGSALRWVSRCLGPTCISANIQGSSILVPRFVPRMSSTYTMIMSRCLFPALASSSLTGKGPCLMSLTKWASFPDLT